MMMMMMMMMMMIESSSGYVISSQHSGGSSTRYGNSSRSTYVTPSESPLYTEGRRVEKWKFGKLPDRSEANERDLVRLIEHLPQALRHAILPHLQAEAHKGNQLKEIFLQIGLFR
jgi:hypothetical protein